MDIRIATYNIEWFDELFTDDNQVKQDVTVKGRVDALVEVFTLIDADLIGVTEAPNTATTGTKNTVQCLESFAAAAGLRTSKAMTGFISRGRQELAFLFDPDKVQVLHDPGGAAKPNAPRFDEEFREDADQDGIDELYRHFRPPLEVRVEPAGAVNFNPFWVMLAHTKSKGIFDRADFVHWQRMSQRNRRKLFAECLAIRARVDEWLDANRPVIVLGDINDGPGMDGHEARFGRSAVELIMGDLFLRDRILTSHGGPARFGPFGWEPSSARYTDQFTGDKINALIDHILASSDIQPAGATAHKVWNPFQLNEAAPHKQAFLDASDHFPVTLDIVL